MLQQWQLMKSNGRSVRDLTRTDLEDLIMEMHEELDGRCIKSTKLSRHVSVLNSNLTALQTTLQESNLAYFQPAPALRPDTQYKTLKKELSKKKDPDSPFRYTQEHFQKEVVGSYNPYQGGNRRIVTLRHRIGDLTQQIYDTKDETRRYQNECQKLAKSLETRNVPKIGFKPPRPIPKYAKKEGGITGKQVIDALEQMIENERDQDDRQYLICAHMLLTGNDQNACIMFQDIYQPNFAPDDPRVLKDQLSDRNAQISLLFEQYKGLAENHDNLMDAYLDLQRRLQDHLIDDDAVKNNLHEQIEKLQKNLDTIPVLQKEIETLSEKKQKLSEDVKEIVRTGRASVDVEVKLKNDAAEIKKNKAGLSVEQAQLERINAERKEQHQTLAEVVRALNEEIHEISNEYDEKEGQRNIIKDRCQLLRKARVNTSARVKEISEISRETLPSEIYQRKSELAIETQNKIQVQKALKKKCKDLNISIKDKENQEKDLLKRIKKSQEALDASKKESEEINRNKYKRRMSVTFEEPEKKKSKKKESESDDAKENEGEEILLDEIDSDNDTNKEELPMEPIQDDSVASFKSDNEVPQLAEESASIEEDKPNVPATPVSDSNQSQSTTSTPSSQSSQRIGLKSNYDNKTKTMLLTPVPKRKHTRSTSSDDERENSDSYSSVK